MNLIRIFQNFVALTQKYHRRYITLSLLLFMLASCQTEVNTPPTDIPSQQAAGDLQLTPAAVEISPNTQITVTIPQTPSPEPSLPPTSTHEPAFTFVVNGDTAMHAGSGEMDSPQYFRGMAESIASLPDVRFLITVGDTTPPQDTRWTIDEVLGEDFLWYPAVGNHELYPADLKWLREYNDTLNETKEPKIVNTGPEGCEKTTYSFDYLNSHFVVLNIYCDLDNEMRTDGAIVDHLYNWLEKDLEMTQKEHVFVIGHEPAFPQPDASAGVTRHEGESLDKYPITRDRFWALLKKYGVLAYMNGHTHSYSVVLIDGVWQMDTAHSMGARTQSTRSTYIAIHVQGTTVNYDTYRVNNLTDQYELFESGTLVE